MTVGMRTTGNTIATGALVAAGIGMATSRMKSKKEVPPPTHKLYLK